ncbi:hypothetical protein RQP46_007730 [Phenoliferia psychrophenolica]
MPSFKFLTVAACALVLASTPASALPTGKQAGSRRPETIRLVSLRPSSPPDFPRFLAASLALAEPIEQPVFPDGREYLALTFASNLLGGDVPSFEDQSPAAIKQAPEDL